MLEPETIHTFTLWSLIAVIVQFSIVLGVTLRVMLTRHPPGAAFAWILITAVIPYVGFVLYLMIGERPLGRHREKLYRKLHLKEHFSGHIGAARLPEHLDEHKGLFRLATRVSRFPLTEGSSITLISETHDIFSAMLRDIRSAAASIDLEFYILWDEGDVRVITDALAEACARGVRVRLLLDDFGSHTFLKSERRKELERAGLEIVPAMPMQLLGMLGLQRADLRLHRKSLIVDERIAYTGSCNLIDPDAYPDAKIVGKWIDAMVRLEGPVVSSMQLVFTTDWCLQPSQQQSKLPSLDLKEQPRTGEATSVLVPSGPYSVHDPNLYLLLEAIGQARHSLTITTPYFVPNETLMTALQTAAFRGVRIQLIIPERGNNAPVTWAGRRHFEALLDAGVNIWLYHGGLLHTKSIEIDGKIALFGTVNLDNRSLHLNFETTLLAYDTAFLSALQALHNTYISASTRVQICDWKARPLKHRLKEGLGYLISPLL